MGIAVNSNWSIDDSSDLYNIPRWGCGFFGVDKSGQLVAKLDGKDVSIYQAIEQVRTDGFQPPFIVRIPNIIFQRVKQLNQAFESARQQFKYAGKYRCFYPTKVNQHRDVIAAAAKAGRQFGGGVEAGSKAELFALLFATDPAIPILCNGFKDETIIEMALRGHQLGRDITIVIEKPGELEMIISIARILNVKPKLGVRVKLAARSGGRWTDSGGSRSKFGLTTTQLLDVVKRLKQEQLAECLQLLHYHPGSQISNVRKIKNSIVEAARIYVDLVQSGVALKILDVGGGLAIDYTGERNQDPSSKNYSLEEYANDVVFYIQQVCKEAGVVEPDIISESGRAITAHHSLLVVPILENQRQEDSLEQIDQEVVESSHVIKELKLIYESLSPGNLSESFHDAQATVETILQMFSLGAMTLKQRSCGERLVQLICQRVAGMLGELDFVPSELVELRHQLADVYVANFSLFQAIPDSWALGQIFPVAPIHRLDQRPMRQAIIGDITCDSDGKMDCFIGSRGGRNSLPVHELDGKPYLIGIFLVGAYQEALSDDHNLMGDYHVLTIHDDGNLTVNQGASTLDVLEHVNHQRSELLESLENSLSTAFQNSSIPQNQIDPIRSFFSTIMNSYTYLETHSEKESPRPHLTAGTRHKQSITTDTI